MMDCAQCERHLEAAGRTASPRPLLRISGTRCPPWPKRLTLPLIFAAALEALIGTTIATPSPTPTATASGDSVPVGRYVFAIETTAPAPESGCAQLYGYSLESDGGLYRYDHTCIQVPTPPYGPRGISYQAELSERYGLRRVLIDHVDPAKLRREVPIILPASWGTLHSAGADPAARTTRTYVAYLYMPSTQGYRRVVLRAVGAHAARSNTQAADEIAGWLDKVIDPDRREAKIAGHLHFPVEALEAGCTGLRGLLSAIAVDRNGLVIVRQAIHPPAAAAWNIAPAAAAALLDEAGRIHLMQRDLHDGAVDAACSLTATIGAVAHEVDWIPGTSKVPGDIRRLFNAMQSLGGTRPAK